MNKRMEVLIVETTERGTVEVTQPSYSGEADGVISIPVEQIDILVEWLKEAKAEIINKTQARLTAPAGRQP